ncbi:MAG: chromate transporter [Paludibacteraceae bacterium]|nr:chromate transporter [Paludibacteraceae bacterium]
MFFQLLWTYLKIGTFTLGGGYAMLPLIEKEVVDRHQWLDGKEFLNMMALAQAAPGLIAINSAIFLGHRLYGWKGVIACVLGAALPSIVIILLIAMFFMNIRENATVEAVFRGIRPAVVGLIVAAVIRLVRKI